MKALRVSHHLLLCATPTKAKCCDPTIGAASWTALKQGVNALGLESAQRDAGIVLRTKADCLRICEQGPILLIWPDGCWYGGVTPDRVDRILREHVIGGQPIEEWLIQRSAMDCSQRTAS
ncbi:MAG: (2Fe-2S) ferredoxin domain-containing protein [Synechococcus sp.]